MAACVRNGGRRNQVEERLFPFVYPYVLFDFSSLPCAGITLK